MAIPKKSPKPTKSFGTKFRTFLHAEYKTVLFMLFFFVLNASFFAMAYIRYGASLSDPLFVILSSIMLLANIALCGFLFFAKAHTWPIEKIFLVVGTSLGFIFLFAIPMGRAPDEPAHIWKVYSVAQGNLLTETRDEKNGTLLPDNLTTFGNTYVKDAYNQIADRLLEPTSNNQVFQEIIGSNPIDYIPQIIGVIIGRILNLPVTITLYLARFCGFAFCIIILYFCLKYIPILKKPLFFLSCLPLSMQTFVSISYDGVIFCSAIALFTFILYSIHQVKFKLNIQHYLLLIVLSILLVAVKPVYFPLCLLLFFIPNRCFKNKKQKILTTLSILILTMGFFLLWSALSVAAQPGNGADSGGQISYILAHPIHYIVILIRNILDMPFLYLQRLGALEWLDASTNHFYIISTLIMFIVLCINEYLIPTKNKISKNFRIATLITSLSSIVLVFTALYIQWTPVGAFEIEGVQTRYLLPIAITFPLLFISHSNTTPSRKKLIRSIYLYSFMIFLNFNAISVLICIHS